jgi:hypothetical protein
MDPANLLTKWHWIVELARKKPGTVLLPRDNQGETAASIRIRMRRDWTAVVRA